jgi:TatD DNase family protein
MFYDAHTHLNSKQLFPDRKLHLEDFYNCWGKGLINIGVDQLYNQRALEIASQREKQEQCMVKAAIGYHPCIVDEQSLQKSDIWRLISNLRSQIAWNREHIIALGEIGVDLYRWESKETKILQQELFDTQCHLATELKLPIIIHSRAAFDETMEILNHHHTLDIYFHCRGYSPTQLDKLSTFFWHCWTWFCGNISYPKAQELRDSLSHLIMNYWWWNFWQVTTDNWQSIRVLLETDAPYLAIQSERWQVQTPAKIGLLYEYVAQLLQIEQKTLQAVLAENFRLLYGI